MPLEIREWKSRRVRLRVEGETLAGADLRGADLRGADLRNHDLTNADLTGADLRRALLGRRDPPSKKRPYPRPGRGPGPAALPGACLREADLREANLMGVDLTGADLRGARVSGPVLGCAVVLIAFVGGVLAATGALLLGERLTGEFPDGVWRVLSVVLILGGPLGWAVRRYPTWPPGTSLAGARLEGARLDDLNLRGVNLTLATYDERTVWPPGFNPEAAGARREEAAAGRE